MSNVSSVTKFFPVAKEGFVTTLGSTITSGAGTVPLNSVTGYSNGDVVALVIEPTDTNKKQVFTGTVDTSGVQITGVVWTEGTNQSHAAGVTVVDYVTATHMSMLTKGLKLEHDDDGTHGVVTATSLATSGAVTVGSGLTVSAGSVALPNNSIDANELSTSAIKLGKAQITSSITTTSNGTAVQATGLSASVTIPAGGRSVRITAYIPRAQHNSAGQYFVGSIWDGTVGSGTQLVDAPVYQATAANTGGHLLLSAEVTPSAGAKTYNVGFCGTTGNTTTIAVGATSPAYILVETI